jgi:hypothetical protein
MPKFEVALLSFGKLIGFMDTDGVFNFTWFGDPKGNSFKGMAANRAQLGQILRALLDRDASDSPSFDAAAGLRWEALSPFSGADVGFIWNEDTADPLQIGLGARTEIPISDKELALSVLARLLKITSLGDVSAELGKIRFAGSFPVPDFLQSAALAGEYDDGLTFTLTAADPDNNRVLSLATPLTAAATTALPWDAARLATFVLRAWLRQQAAASLPGPPKNFFRRVDDHLFPMLGDPASVIHPFPLLADPMGTVPSFDDWQGSILTTDANASGALTFLWHLRALVTGNTSPNVLPGSRWLALVGGPEQAAGTPAPPSFQVTGSYPPEPPEVGAWLGVRESPTDAGATELVIDLRNGTNGPQGVQTIVLLRRSGTTFTLPGMPDSLAFGDLSTFLENLTPLAVGAQQITFDPPNGRLKLVSETVSGSGVGVLDGEYSIELVLRPGAAVSYRFNTPLLGMELPPNAVDDPKVLVSQLIEWVIEFVTAAPEAGPFAEVAEKIGTLITDAIKTGTVTPAAVFGAVAAVISQGQTLEFGPLSIGINGGELTPAVEFGPIGPDQMPGEDPPWSIGKIKVEATLNVLPPVTQPFQGFAIAIIDVRLGSGGGGAAGLVAGLIPDMRDMPGFMLKVGFEAPDHVIVEGGGKIPIQKTIGPLDVVALMIELREDSLGIGIDLSFQLSVIKVTVYELGLRFNFKPPEGTLPVEVFLHGLGLSFDGGGIKLAGMFAEVAKEEGPPDYVGGAVVSIVNLFQLSAIGAYTEVEGEASLFLFASLVAPLGGPPYCFITGIAGGFGFNRSLPPPGLLTDHPFIKVMRGEIPMGSGDAASLATISGLFAAQKGTYWIAGGIQFTSFGLIQGKVIVAVQFGNKFSFNLLGLAAFGISPVAYFELGIEITADEEKFLLKAGLSKNSYIIHPDIFSLQGDFGLGIWYASPHKGDFILSIGGYHPYFKVPSHYPELARVGVKCTIFGFVRLSVEAFFALTPQALMAGVAVSLSAEFAGIGAGLDVYIDVFITWDPFYLIARMGVIVWFEFLGRHEIGVELKIFTPDFGGIATIDLMLVSFDVEFGAKENPPAPPRLDEFISNQLGAAAEEGAYNEATTHSKAVLKRFNTSDDDAGLFKIDVTFGRTTKKQSTSSKQEGIDAPIPVNAEFGFVLRTRLPVRETDAPLAIVLPLEGEVDLPLCTIMDLSSKLSLATTGFDVTEARKERSGDFYPAANFGDILDNTQADDLGARGAVAKASDTEPAIALTDGIVFNCYASSTTTPPALVGLGEEDSLAEEEYPLPLGTEQPLPVYRQPKSQALFKNALPAAHFTAKQVHQSSKQLAVAAIQARTWGPLFVSQIAGDVQRLQVGAAIKGLKYTIPAAPTLITPIATPITGRAATTADPVRPTPIGPAVPVTPIGPAVPVRPTGPAVPITPSVPITPGTPTIPGAAALPPQPIAVPSSPRRRAELFGITLRMVAPRSAIKMERGRLENHTPAKNFTKRALTSARGTRAAFTTTATVAVGKAVTLELQGGRLRKTQLTLSGSQSVRVIFQGSAQDLISDQYITGNIVLAVPPRARRVTLVGEGMHPPIAGSPLAGVAAPVIKEALGVEHDTTLLALGRRVFAAHGCVLVANTAMPFAARPMDSVPGFKVLRAVTRCRVHWPSVPKGCLALIVEPIGGDPVPALDEIRWYTMGAQLRGLSTVAGTAATALLMDVTAPKQWWLELDLGMKWRLAGVTVVQKSARDMTNLLRGRDAWDIVDDRLQLAADQPATTATLQVTQ